MNEWKRIDRYGCVLLTQYRDGQGWFGRVEKENKNTRIICENIHPYGTEQEADTACWQAAVTLNTLE